MIKSGIVGGAGAAQLLQILLHHPDVDLRWVADVRQQGRRLDQMCHLLKGETEMTFVGEPQWDDLDLLFLCDTEAGGGDLLQELPQAVRVIDLTGRYRHDEQAGFAYGLCEAYRRLLVHDCTRVTCPSDVAMALSLSLVPLAKNLMLNSELHATVVVGNAQADVGSRVVLATPQQFQSQSDEVCHVLSSLQTSFSSPLHLTVLQACFARGLLATVYFKCAVEQEMVRELFEQYYDDHNFAYVCDELPALSDVVGTNKCLLHIARDGEYLRVTSAIDNLIKGGAGNAVHLMNLLFGLHERVGLML